MGIGLLISQSLDNEMHSYLPCTNFFFRFPLAFFVRRSRPFHVRRWGSAWTDGRSGHPTCRRCRGFVAGKDGPLGFPFVFKLYFFFFFLFFHYFYSGRGLPIFCADLQQELVDLCSAKGSLMILPTILFLSTGVLKETAVKTIDPVEVIE